MPIEIKPDSSNPSPGPIKRRTFLGLGLTGVAGLSLPGLTRLHRQAANPDGFVLLDAQGRELANGIRR